MSSPSPNARLCIRPGVRVEPHGTDGYVLFDSFHYSDTVLSLSPLAFQIAKLFNGSYTLDQIYAKILIRGWNLSLSQFMEMVSAFEQARFFDDAAFQAYLTGPIRRPACLGCYPPEPEKIHVMLDQLFTNPGGPGLPDPCTRSRSSERLRAIFVPHMDYARGGVTYGWGFRELIEQTDANLFVIVATSHYSANRFTLTRMNFETPLGIVTTDHAYVDRIAAEYGDSVYSDPYAHLPEHSIELEVLLLQHIMRKKKSFRIVPLLVGSFHDCVATNVNPVDRPDIRRMVDVLRNVEEQAGEPVCYLISGDLAHIGPKFQDPAPVSSDQLKLSQLQDRRILDHLEAVNVSGFYRTIAQERDARRICGFPPAWVTLETVRPTRGKFLHYQQYVHPQGNESVSFASLAFYSE